MTYLAGPSAGFTIHGWFDTAGASTVSIGTVGTIGVTGTGFGVVETVEEIVEGVEAGVVTGVAAGTTAGGKTATRFDARDYVKE